MASPSLAHVTSAVWGSLEKQSVTFIRGVLIPLDDNARDGDGDSDGCGYRTVDVTLCGGKITGLEPVGTAPPPEGALVVEGANKLLLPGSVNAHTHTSEHWARGLIKPLPLELWIHQLVW
jgi:cytosine/adenosine deaminase-related metal-dependent hydrolase